MDWDAVRGRLRGPAALVSSIFHDDLSLDDEAIRRNVRRMVDRGFGQTTGFMVAPCGDGEYVTLSPEEHRRVVAAAVQASDGSVPVVAGVNSTDERAAFAFAEGARAAGAIAVMMAPPVYYALTDEAILTWYQRFAERVDIGIMLYEQSWRGPTVNAGIGPNLLARLVRIPNVVAMKHTGLYNVAQEIEILDRFADRISYIDTTAAYVTTLAHIHGAAGFVSEFSTWWPEFELRFWELLEAGRYAEAELGHARLDPIFEYMWTQGGAHSPVTVLKAAMEYAGFEGGPVRPPFRALDAAEKDGLAKVLDAIGAPPASMSTADRAVAVEHAYSGAGVAEVRRAIAALELVDRAPATIWS